MTDWTPDWPYDDEDVRIAVESGETATSPYESLLDPVDKVDRLPTPRIGRAQGSWHVDSAGKPFVMPGLERCLAERTRKLRDARGS